MQAMTAMLYLQHETMTWIPFEWSGNVLFMKVIIAY